MRHGGRTIITTIITTMKVVASVCAGILLISACGIGYSSPPRPKPPSPPNIAPHILRIWPNAVRSGIDVETIVIRGSGFNENCRAKLDSEQVETVYGDGEVVYAKLGKQQLAKPHTAVVQVECPLLSNQIELQIK